VRQHVPLHAKNTRRDEQVRTRILFATGKNRILELRTRTCDRVFSSRTKANTLSHGTGSQMEVEALSTTPLGWPGSVLRCTMTRTPTSLGPDSVVHRWSCDALRLAQKLLTIRCDSFIMLRFPSGVTAQVTKRE
jgi:hypothetical protein